MPITVHGPSFSTYVRSVRLALEEKGAPYELVDVGMLAGEHKEPAHLRRHPFGKVPAFDHDGFALYETDAILRYVDEALPGPRLQPSDAKCRARMNQIMSIVNGYAYPAVITNIVIQRMLVPMMGGTPDEAVIAEGRAIGAICLAELDRLIGEGPFCVGDAISLADLMLAPVVAYLPGVPDGAELMQGRANLARWWSAMDARPSMGRTQPSFL